MARQHVSLVVPQKRSGGRNNNGRVTAWHRGGGHKQHYRIIDWKRDKDGIPGKVERIEYDPNRTANIALVLYADGERRYMIASKDLTVGSVVQSGVDAPVAVGNCLPLTNIPVGSVVHCIELKPGKGAQLARSAGGSVQFLAREGSHAFDKQGNYSMGVLEQIVFPEIKYDKIDALRGLNITITTTAKNKQEGLALLQAMNFPIKET